MFGIAGGGHEGREPIEAGEDAVLDRARLDRARPADDARHAEAALEDGALGGLERRHAAVGPGEHLGAVVGGEDRRWCCRPRRCRPGASAARRCCRPSAPCRPPPDRSWSCCSSSPGTSGTRNVQTCMRVVLCQTKNGLPSFLALSMKSLEVFDQHLVEGRHVVLGLRTACRACSARWTCPGTAAAGPHPRSSACRPCPSAACSVGSSVSVAQQCTRLRGPYLL